VFLGRVVPRRLVVRAAVVPDHDIAAAPAVAVLTLGLDHPLGQLLDQVVALRLLQSLDAEDLARIEVEALALRLRMHADDGMEDGRPVSVGLVEAGGSLAAAAVGEGAPSPLEARGQRRKPRLARRRHSAVAVVAATARL